MNILDALGAGNISCIGYGESHQTGTRFHRRELLRVNNQWCCFEMICRRRNVKGISLSHGSQSPGALDRPPAQEHYRQRYFVRTEVMMETVSPHHRPILCARITGQLLEQL